jgi:hypothetical protein
MVEPRGDRCCPIGVASSADQMYRPMSCSVPHRLTQTFLLSGR